MSENTNTNNDNVEIGALWKKQGKSQKFLSGTINLKAIGYDKDVPVIVFSNKFKQKDSHPDLRIYLSKPKAGANAITATSEKPAVKQAPTPAKTQKKVESVETENPQPEMVTQSDDEVF